MCSAVPRNTLGNDGTVLWNIQYGKGLVLVTPSERTRIGRVSAVNRRLFRS